MKTTDYKNLQNQAREYMVSLDLKKVKAEFTLSPLLNRNKKLEKGDGIENWGLELTPSKFASEVNLCGNEGQCLFTCLVFSGVANMMKSKSMILSTTLKKRLRRTFLYLNDQEFLLKKLDLEIQTLLALNEKVAIRLNVFSDINWESIMDLDILNDQGAIFYDYTKRKTGLETVKRSLTFSASEKDSDEDILALLKKGFNVAMVFHTNKLPETWNGVTVINGDINDRRYEDPKGVIVGLVQKTTMGGKEKTKFTERV